jgi:hypothetical protein
MRWIGYFDVSVFWLVILLFLAYSMQSSNTVFFEDDSVLMENITNQDAFSVRGSCCGSYDKNENATRVQAVLTSGEIDEYVSCNYYSTSVHCLYGVTEIGAVLIMY